MKKLLSVIGLLTIAIPTTLTVVGCGNNAVTNTKESEVVSAINKVGYETSVLTNSSIVGLKKIITNEFIKSELSADIQAKFEDKFSFTSLWNIDTENELTENDFLESKTVWVKMFYRYGSISNQNVSLAIHVLNDIMETVRNIDQVEYQLEEVVSGNVNDLKAKITNEFIKSKLRADVQEVYRDSFSVSGIIDENGHNLSLDYPIGTILKTTLLYTYEGSTSQTKLEIKIIDQMIEKFVLEKNSDSSITTLLPALDGNFYAVQNSIFGKGGAIWEINPIKNELNQLATHKIAFSNVIQGLDGNLYGTIVNDVLRIDINNKTVTRLAEIPHMSGLKTSIVYGLDGNLYIAENSAAAKEGTLWKIDLKTNNVTKIANFLDNFLPEFYNFPRLFTSSNGNLYIVTVQGVYEVNLKNNQVTKISSFEYALYASIQFSDHELLIVAGRELWKLDLNSRLTIHLFSLIKLTEKYLNLVKNSDGQIIIIDYEFDAVNHKNIYGITRLQTNSRIEIKTDFDCLSWIFGPNNKLYIGTSNSSIYEFSF